MWYHFGMKKTWKSTPNAVYEINYHFVWSTKYRKPVLLPPVDAKAKEVPAHLAEEHGYEVLGMEVMPDHVHIFISAPPAVSPAVIAKILKGASARRLFEAFPLDPVLLHRHRRARERGDDQALHRGAKDRCRC